MVVTHPCRGSHCKESYLGKEFKIIIGFGPFTAFNQIDTNKDLDSTKSEHQLGAFYYLELFT